VRFRALLAKVGSGERTSRDLSRAEACEAMDLMLEGHPSDAQLGAFLIAHRIRRPTALELAGMLDSYRSHGPVLRTPGRQAIGFGVPYDGRSRTAPVLPLLALALAAAEVPVVLHGGNPMPVKYGVCLAELFAVLGVDWSGLGLEVVQDCLERCNLALTHQPVHFPEAERFVRIREELGKRPPVASLELLWTPHQGEHLLVSGFVHQPTEARAWEALLISGERNVLTIKGLEGSTDLPTSRVGIAARVRDGVSVRHLLHPRDHGLEQDDPPWQGLERWQSDALAALAGDGPLAPALLWNLAVQLWQLGHGQDLSEALLRARALLNGGHALRTLQRLRRLRP
jgi:anthranilate phosphoribosyltransferase